MNRVEYGGYLWTPVQLRLSGFDTSDLDSQQKREFNACVSQQGFVTQLDNTVRCPNNYVLRPGDFVLVRGTRYVPVSAEEYDAIVGELACVA